LIGNIIDLFAGQYRILLYFIMTGSLKINAKRQTRKDIKGRRGENS